MRPIGVQPLGTFSEGKLLDPSTGEDNRSPVSGTFIRRLTEGELLDPRTGENNRSLVSGTFIRRLTEGELLDPRTSEDNSPVSDTFILRLT